jgi:hypothetical protein
MATGPDTGTSRRIPAPQATPLKVSPWQEAVPLRPRNACPDWASHLRPRPDRAGPAGPRPGTPPSRSGRGAKRLAPMLPPQAQGAGRLLPPAAGSTYNVQGDPPRARGNPKAGRCRGNVPTGTMKKCAIPLRPPDQSRPRQHGRTPSTAEGRHAFQANGLLRSWARPRRSCARLAHGGWTAGRAVLRRGSRVLLPRGPWRRGERDPRESGRNGRRRDDVGLHRPAA